jgi:hypothetical protein
VRFYEGVVDSRSFGDDDDVMDAFVGVKVWLKMYVMPFAYCLYWPATDSLPGTFRSMNFRQSSKMRHRGTHEGGTV